MSPDRDLAAEQAALPRGVGEALAFERYQPPPLGEAVGLPWHEARSGLESACGTCGAAGGSLREPCFATPIRGARP